MLNVKACCSANFFECKTEDNSLQNSTRSSIFWPHIRIPGHWRLWVSILSNTAADEAYLLHSDWKPRNVVYLLHQQNIAVRGPRTKGEWNSKQVLIKKAEIVNIDIRTVLLSILFYNDTMKAGKDASGRSQIGKSTAVSSWHPDLGRLTALILWNANNLGGVRK